MDLEILATRPTCPSCITRSVTQIVVALKRLHKSSQRSLHVFAQVFPNALVLPNPIYASFLFSDLYWNTDNSPNSGCNEERPLSTHCRTKRCQWSKMYRSTKWHNAARFECSLEDDRNPFIQLITWLEKYEYIISSHDLNPSPATLQLPLFLQNNDKIAKQIASASKRHEFIIQIAVNNYIEQTEGITKEISWLQIYLHLIHIYSLKNVYLLHVVQQGAGMLYLLNQLTSKPTNKKSTIIICDLEMSLSKIPKILSDEIATRIQKTCISCGEEHLYTFSRVICDGVYGTALIHLGVREVVEEEGIKKIYALRENDLQCFNKGREQKLLDEKDSSRHHHVFRYQPSPRVMLPPTDFMEKIVQSQATREEIFLEQKEMPLLCEIIACLSWIPGLSDLFDLYKQLHDKAASFVSEVDYMNHIEDEEIKRKGANIYYIRGDKPSLLHASERIFKHHSGQLVNFLKSVAEFYGMYGDLWHFHKLINPLDKKIPWYGYNVLVAASLAYLHSQSNSENLENLPGINIDQDFLKLTKKPLPNIVGSV
uniref:Uncharacterized protein n=1 Tax=Glossina pallidipes TaxID=7398 RepID=A0A1A9Z4F3_GLOPL